MSDRVIIFDTTLRDGEQSLSASLGVREKLQIARALERLGVDVMEVGFPVSSPGDFESVQAIAAAIKNSRVCALARALPADIDVAAQALHSAEEFRIHTFISTSSIHVQNKLRKSFDDVLDMSVTAVKHALRYTDDVEFSCEDAGRTSIDYLCRMVEAVINAGATTVNIPDTVGYTLPGEFSTIIQTLFNRVPNIDKAILSVHCHDDLGMSVANSICAIEQGVRQVECTINGIGERAGNCSLEEVAMILHTRAQKMQVHTQIQHSEIYRTSKLVSNLCNMPIQANKAIVGSNAFSHSSGIHQDGVLKSKNTYEIMTPESIGRPPKPLNLTSRSGRHVIQNRMKQLGYSSTDYDLETLYQAFVKLADKKGQVFDYDLEALLFFANLADSPQYFQLKHIGVQSGGDTATATVRMTVGENEHIDAATGNGPVDALYRAIMRISGIELKIGKYGLKSQGEGRDALGQVDIEASYQGRVFHGMGLATDIIQASANALNHVINSIHFANQVAHKKQQAQLEKHV